MDWKDYEAEHRESLDLLRRLRPDAGTSCICEQPLPETDGKTILDIIVPAYNVEKYIDACLRSVLKQKTQYPFRLIVVDDGSPDRTGERIDRYKDSEETVIIHQSNRGMAGARNAGLLHSHAKYIMFLDSDDLLAVNAVERMVSTTEKEEADILGCSYCNFRLASFLHRKYRQRAGVLHSELELFGQPWGKLYRRELFEKIRFPEHYWFEDSLMQQIVYPSAERLIGIQDILYMRRVNLRSITQNAAGDPRSIDTVWVTLRLLEDRKTLQIPFNQAYYDCLLEQLRLNHTRLLGLETEIRKAAFLVAAGRIRREFPTFQTQAENNRETEAAVREMDFERFAADYALRN